MNSSSVTLFIMARSKQYLTKAFVIGGLELVEFVEEGLLLEKGKLVKFERVDVLGTEADGVESDWIHGAEEPGVEVGPLLA